MQTKIATTAAEAEVDDYPCVRRLRHRRTLAYLHSHGFEAAFHSMIQELTQRQHTVFSIAHLRKLVARGRLGDAVRYVPCCLSLPTGDVPARALILFLVTLGGLANLAANGSSDIADVIAAAEQRRRRDAVLVYHCRHNAKLSSIIDTMLNSPQYRASLDWELVKKESSTIAHDLAVESPELSRRDVLRLPAPGGPQDVLRPILRSCRRRRYLKKQARRPVASAIAKLCLSLNKRSQPFSLGPPPGMEAQVPLDRAADLVEKCLKAGKRPELHQVHPLQSTRIQGLSQEESACIQYVESHYRLDPNTMLVDIGGYRLNAQNLKCLTIDKTHDGREKYVPTTVMSAYIKIVSSRHANCVLSDSDWSQDIPSIGHGDVSTMQSVNFLDHAMFLTQRELVFIPMLVEVHFIVLVINNKRKHFQVLDSLRTYARYQSQINSTVREIKNLLEKARRHGLHEVPDVTNWPVNLIYHIPLQEDSCSCSLFALKYIELWDGERVSISFNQSDIHSFRVQVLVELLLSELNVINNVKSELCRLLDDVK